jgi:hypothetical protein
MLTVPMRLHVVAMQHASIPQAKVPMQLIVHVSPLHRTFWSQVLPPVH